MPREESFRRSNMRALRALALDPSLAEPYVALGNNAGNDIAYIDRPTMIVLMRPLAVDEPGPNPNVKDK